MLATIPPLQELKAMGLWFPVGGERRFDEFIMVSSFPTCGRAWRPHLRLSRVRLTSEFARGPFKPVLGGLGWIAFRSSDTVPSARTRED